MKHVCWASEDTCMKNPVKGRKMSMDRV